MLGDQKPNFCSILEDGNLTNLFIATVAICCCCFLSVMDKHLAVKHIFSLPSKDLKMWQKQTGWASTLECFHYCYYWKQE